jgi:hypothetical protein
MAADRWHVHAYIYLATHVMYMYVCRKKKVAMDSKRR